jgi:hypothetical protein
VNVEQEKTVSIENASRVSLEIGTRRNLQLNVINKALGMNDEKTAVMCMRRFFNQAPCTGNTVYCGECPVSGQKGMGEYGHAQRN